MDITGLPTGYNLRSGVRETAEWRPSRIRFGKVLRLSSC